MFTTIISTLVLNTNLDHHGKYEGGGGEGMCSWQNDSLDRSSGLGIKCALGLLSFCILYIVHMYPRFQLESTATLMHM